MQLGGHSEKHTHVVRICQAMLYHNQTETQPRTNHVGLPYLMYLALACPSRELETKKTASGEFQAVAEQSEANEPAPGEFQAVAEQSEANEPAPGEFQAMAKQSDSVLITASEQSRMVIKIGRIEEIRREREMAEHIKTYNKNRLPKDRINAVDYMRRLHDCESEKIWSYLMKLTQSPDHVIHTIIQENKLFLNDPNLTDEQVIEETVKDGCVVMEKYDKTLLDWIEWNIDPDMTRETQLEAINIAIKFLDAVIKLKRLNIIHGDLKLENVMLTRDNEIVIIDFGSSSILEKGEKTRKFPPFGTEQYFSLPLIRAFEENENAIPEERTNPEYDHMVDVYPAYRVVAELLNLNFHYRREKRKLWVSELYPGIPYFCWGSKKWLFEGINRAFRNIKTPNDEPDLVDHMLEQLQTRLSYCHKQMQGHFLSWIPIVGDWIPHSLTNFWS